MASALQYIVLIVVCVVGCIFSHNIGYKNGARRVLNEWRAFNNQISGQCQHGIEWEECPECSD